MHRRESRSGSLRSAFRSLNPLSTASLKVRSAEPADPTAPGHRRGHKVSFDNGKDRIGRPSRRHRKTRRPSKGFFLKRRAAPVPGQNTQSQNPRIPTARSRGIRFYRGIDFLLHAADMPDPRARPPRPGKSESLDGVGVSRNPRFRDALSYCTRLPLRESPEGIGSFKDRDFRLDLPGILQSIKQGDRFPAPLHGPRNIAGRFERGRSRQQAGKKGGNSRFVAQRGISFIARRSIHSSAPSQTEAGGHS